MSKSYSLVKQQLKAACHQEGLDVFLINYPRPLGYTHDGIRITGLNQVIAKSEDGKSEVLAPLSGPISLYIQKGRDTLLSSPLYSDLSTQDDFEDHLSNDVIAGLLEAAGIDIYNSGVKQDMKGFMAYLWRSAEQYEQKLELSCE